jgi:hypothetical protein
MGPEKLSFKRAVLAGFVATAILTILMFLAPVAGLPRIDLASALGKPFSGGRAVAALWSGSWWMGLGIFALFGSVISPYIFIHAYHGLLGSPWLRGIEWGLFVWVFGGVAVMTMMGMGFDEAHFAHPFASFASSLAGHLLYGAILGGIAGGGLKRLPQNQSRQAHA